MDAGVHRGPAVVQDHAGDEGILLLPSTPSLDKPPSLHCTAPHCAAVCPSGSSRSPSSTPLAPSPPSLPPPPGQRPRHLGPLGLPQLSPPEGPLPHPPSPSPLLQVSVHVTSAPSGCLSFVDKNFTFQVMTLAELMGAIKGGGQSGEGEAGSDTTHCTAECTAKRYYLRSVGVNPRKEPAQLPLSFPELARDVKLPLHLLPPPSASSSAASPLFSSVLRIGSPGIRLWTHYDVMDNVLMQIRVR